MTLIVRDEYQFNELFLEDLAMTNEYWAKVINFYEQVYNKELGELSDSQISWLDKISNDLEEIQLKRNNFLVADE